jgi:hypothetical protein
VTFSVAVSGLAGSLHVVRYRFASASSASAPRSTSRSAAVAVTGLLIEAAWKSVAGVTESAAVAPPAAFTPMPRAHATRPPAITATLTPGTR